MVLQNLLVGVIVTLPKVRLEFQARIQITIAICLPLAPLASFIGSLKLHKSYSLGNKVCKPYDNELRLRGYTPCTYSDVYPERHHLSRPWTQSTAQRVCHKQQKTNKRQAQLYDAYACMYRWCKISKASLWNARLCSIHWFWVMKLVLENINVTLFELFMQYRQHPR